DKDKMMSKSMRTDKTQQCGINQSSSLQDPKKETKPVKRPDPPAAAMLQAQKFKAIRSPNDKIWRADSSPRTPLTEGEHSLWYLQTLNKDDNL
ncbi:hypothetical protein LOZ07_004080, partial [Ophidiomyces ophidiicola]